MQLKLNEKVRSKDNVIAGRIAGFCHLSAEGNSFQVHECVLVRLDVGFYDPSTRLYVSVLPVSSELLESM